MSGRFVLLLGLLICTSVFAEPRQWDADGIPVRAVRSILDYTSVSRDDGTTLVVWAQSQGSDPVILGQLLSPAGTPLWGDEPRLLCQGQFKAGFPIAIAADGGWVIVWLDSRLIASDSPTTGWYGVGSMRAAKIDDNGAHLWSNGLAGIELVPSSYGWMQKPYELHRDGTGVIVTYYLDDHWAVKLSANGTFEWPEPVLLRLRNYWDPFNTATDPAGGVLFSWYNILAGDTILFANKLLSNGSFAWNDTAGVEVHRGQYRYDDIGVCSDGLGGMFVTWGHNGTAYDRFVQHLTAEGTRTWPVSGVLVATLSDQTRTFDFRPSFNGAVVDGVLLALKVYLQSSSAHVVQKIRLDGTRAWGESGILICEPDETVSFEDIAISSDFAAGMLCSYESISYLVPYEWENNLIRFGASGDRMWGENCGFTVSGAPNRSMQISQPFRFGDNFRFVWMEWNEDEQTVKAQDVTLAGVPVHPQPRLLGTGEVVYTQNQKVVELGGGASAVTWEENGWDAGTVRFQMFDAFGTPQFAEPRTLAYDEEGVPLYARDCALGYDGNGGFFAVFGSFESGFFPARVVHIDRFGNHVGPTNGVTLEFGNTVEMEGRQSQLYRDGTGGCFVTVAMYDELYYLKVHTTRLNAECAPVWTEPVNQTVTDRDVFIRGMAPSVDGSVMVAYSIHHYPDQEERAARISADGMELWDVPVTNGMIDYSSDVVACSDRNNGIVVVWDDYLPTEEEHRLYAQRISPAGERLWITQGLQVAPSETNISGYSCSADQLGNVTVAWSEYVTGGNNIRAQRVSAAGTVQWGETGNSVCDVNGDQDDPQVFAISDNEVYVLWRDYRNATQEVWETDIYGTHLDARGRIRDDAYWQANGSPVCNYPYSQYRYAAVDDHAGGLVVVWMDERTSMSWEYSMFAQRLFDPIFSDADQTPVVVSEFSLSQNYPNPFNPETVIEFALPTTGQTTLRVFDITGREVATLVDNPLTAGNHRVLFDGSKLASGVYFYSLRTASQSLTRKMVVLK